MRTLRVKTANESFCKHFRVSPSQTENRLVYELGNGQWNIPRLRTFLEEVLPRHSFFKDFEVTHEFEGIGRRTVLLSGRQVDHLQRILLFIDDITERLESRAAMRTSEIRYRRLFEAARDGILILDPGTRKITDANPFMSELLGYPHEELLGKELWEIGLLKDETASRAAFQRVAEESFYSLRRLAAADQSGPAPRSGVRQQSLRRRRTKGHPMQHPRHHRAQTDGKGSCATPRRCWPITPLEQELLVAERTATLRETVGELQAFSYSVSHDMRAPLRSMQGFAQFLVDEYSTKLDEQGVNYLQQIMRSAVRLDRLIQDVLSYTRVLHAPDVDGTGGFGPPDTRPHRDLSEWT